MKETLVSAKKQKRVIISFARAERASLPLVAEAFTSRFLPQLVSQHAAVRSLSHTISKKNVLYVA